jgi:hypothetical protein
VSEMMPLDGPCSEWPHPGPVRMYGVGEVDWDDLVPARGPAAREPAEPRALVVIGDGPRARRDRDACIVVVVGSTGGRARRVPLDEAVRMIRAA